MRDPTCRCDQVLRNALTSDSGTVVIKARIPRDIRPGRHTLTLNGTAADEFSELGLTVSFTVER
jgi:hypothetical protein